jgi:hypothetical protein
MIFPTTHLIRLLALLSLVGLAGCSDESGSHPFVPAPGYSCSVTLSVPKEGFVGEWIPLKASLTNGPWIQVPRRDVPDGGIAWPEQPPSFQQEVAASLTWLTDPPGAARFDVPTMQSIQRDPYGRKAMFSQPGVYKIWGISAYPTVSTSSVETITIRVKP